MALNCKTSTWFEGKVKSEKPMEDGLTKSVKEDYVVDAFNFAEAETTLIEEVSAYVTGELNVEALKIASYKEVFFDEDPTADKWYKVKIQMIVPDEKSGKEKRTNINYLVQAPSTQGAFRNTEEIMKGSIIDYVVASITETNILDVIAKGEELKPKALKPLVEETEPIEPVAGEDGFEPLS
ncbi:MAG: DUF4494 domain-containing protein [Prevotellaceae bacterium]|nr:DUF4494 domain-containing protein [Prevotellaceae bacterium]